MDFALYNMLPTYFYFYKLEKQCFLLKSQYQKYIYGILPILSIILWTENKQYNFVFWENLFIFINGIKAMLYYWVYIDYWIQYFSFEMNIRSLKQYNTKI